MGKILKWIGIVLGGLIGLIVLLVLGLYFAGNGRMTKAYDIQPEAVTIPADAAAIEQGRRWARTTLMLYLGTSEISTMVVTTAK